MDPLVNGAELHVNRVTLKQMNNGEEKRKATCVPGDLAELRQLLEKVYKERGFDFREYRVSTLSRRISRRMRARGADGFSSYAQVLDEDPNEYIAFFNDLTINVTSFFRDEIAFNSLKKKVLPQILARKQKQERSVRIWSAACSTRAQPVHKVRTQLWFSSFHVL
jgi:hypothetical protein